MEKKQNKFITSSKQYNRLVLQYRELAYQYLEKIESCLQKRTAESIVEFIQLFNEPELLNNVAPSLAELVYAHIFATISVDEIHEYGHPFFLLNGKSIAELIFVLKQVEFRIWEVQFESKKESEKKLYHTLKTYYITPEAMKSIIHIAAIDKINFYFVFKRFDYCPMRFLPFW